MKVDGLALLGSGVLHDTILTHVRMPNAMRSVSFRLNWTQWWQWSRDEQPVSLPRGIDEARLNRWYFTFTLERLSAIDVRWLPQLKGYLGSSLDIRRVTFICAKIDAVSQPPRTASLPGVAVHSAEIETYPRSRMHFVFERCRATPSDPEVLALWMTHPYWGKLLRRSIEE